jgi:HPt (histidine-containing phosphotransfer) domain-containing protein
MLFIITNKAMDHSEVINWGELMSITGEDISIIKELLDCFLTSIELDLSDLRLFLSRELRMEAEIKAHTIKGAAASIAANRVSFISFRKNKNNYKAKRESNYDI